jgi:hypothetical protein
LCSEPDREVSIDASQLYDLVRRLKLEGTEGNISQSLVVSKQDGIHQRSALKEADRPGTYVETCIVFDAATPNPARGSSWSPCGKESLSRHDRSCRGWRKSRGKMGGPPTRVMPVKGPRVNPRLFVMRSDQRLPFALARLRASITATLITLDLLEIGVRSRRSWSTASRKSWSTRIVKTVVYLSWLMLGIRVA